MRRRSSKEHPDLSVPTLLAGRIPMASLIQTLAVAEHLNFRHAANALGVAQSSVSARVKALEDDLGILLFKVLAEYVKTYHEERKRLSAEADANRTRLERRADKLKREIDRLVDHPPRASVIHM